VKPMCDRELTLLPTHCSFVILMFLKRIFMCGGTTHLRRVVSTCGQIMCGICVSQYVTKIGPCYLPLLAVSRKIPDHTHTVAQSL
jgi:hypothetical protein